MFYIWDHIRKPVGKQTFTEFIALCWFLLISSNFSVLVKKSQFWAKTSLGYLGSGCIYWYYIKHWSVWCCKANPALLKCELIIVCGLWWASDQTTEPVGFPELGDCFITNCLLFIKQYNNSSHAYCDNNANTEHVSQMLKTKQMLEAKMLVKLK